MYFDFWFKPEYKLTIRDAYFLGNIFSYNYMNRDSATTKLASFIALKKKPQRTNSTGWEYSLESFKDYKNSIKEFVSGDPKYNDLSIRILDYEDAGYFDGLTVKKKRGERLLYIPINFENATSYKAILHLLFFKIDNIELLIYLLRGMFDSRGSIDSTIKKIAIDMEPLSSMPQANLIKNKSEELFPELVKIINYNPRNKQPSLKSKKKNAQARPDMFYYMSEIGTLNPQLVSRYLFSLSDNDLINTEIIKNQCVYLPITKNKEGFTTQKIKLSELTKDDDENLKRRYDQVSRKSKNAINSNATIRRYLTIDSKKRIFSDNFNSKTINNKEIDFAMIRWHHAIHNHLKNKIDNKEIVKFIDNDMNFIPLESNDHDLLHAQTEKLNIKNKENKNLLINEIYSYIKSSGLIEELTIEQFRSFYNK